MLANLINHWLLNPKNREHFFDFLGQQFVIYAISREVWEEVKATHTRLKEKELLPIYQKKALEDFYLKTKEIADQTMRLENQEAMDKVMNLFGEDEIKIG
jgi:predicted nucleic acid-binding protein